MGWSAIHKASLAPVPWPNGRGITRDYVVRDGFRVTLAELTEDAPFSQLPGTERVFTIAQGDPVELTVDGVATRCERLQPFRFSGGAQTGCRLLGGAAEAFNLFYDPGRTSADVTVVRDAPIDGIVGPGEHFLFSPDGDAEVEGVAMAAGDLLAGAGPAWVRGTVLLVSVA